jgi:hypothetical protein
VSAVKGEKQDGKWRDRESYGEAAKGTEETDLI